MDLMQRYEVESKEKWSSFQETMPFIELKEGYKFRVTTPFGGVIFRFRVLSPKGNEYSIYFDAYDRAGCFGEPYYELYPHDDDVFRSTDINEILDAIYTQERMDNV